MEIKGIKYISPIFDLSGYGQASRGYVLALHRMGIPLTLSPVSFESVKTDFGKNGEILRSLVNKPIDYNVVIIHLTPEHWPRFCEIGKRNVGYCVWETSLLHPTWSGYINGNVEACMVSCEWNVEVYKNSGVTVPVFSVPHGIDMLEYNDIEPYTVKGVDPEAYKFYSIAQFTERKNPTALLYSYWAAFCKGENVALIFKTYKDGFDEKSKKDLRDIINVFKGMIVLDQYPPVYIIQSPLDRKEILGLHKFGDCCVSLDRGEGFGLTPFEAGAVGNPIIVTGMGGSLEYAKPDNSYLVDHTMTPVFGMNFIPWYRGDQMWAEPNCANAIELMKYVYNNRDKAKVRGDLLKKYIANNLTWEHVGQKMLNFLRSL
ncbi:MAG: glycosyltransferase [Bacilli bacterium]|jgi:glycosyltransferase involved in cell wall biosynthesis